MVALLVAMSVMAILMSAALPAYHTMARREKEAELVFRGEQYARAIGLWQQKFANQPAPSIDVLVEQRFLRKKYKDPITNDEFQLLGAGAAAPGQTQQGTTPQGGGGAQQQATTQAMQRLQQAQETLQQVQQRLASASGRGNPVGGIVGVTSKSTEKSLRLYNGRDTYNQWVFLPVARGGAGGGARGGAPGPEGRGGRGGEGGRQGIGGLPQGTLPQGAGRRGGGPAPAPAPRGRF